MKLVVEEASLATGTLLEEVLHSARAEIEKEALVRQTKSCISF